MEPAHGRRFSRLAVTLWVAVPALVAVALWGGPAWARPFSTFVAVTAAALAAVSVRSSADGE
jgi:hypothetical protein